MSGDIVVRPLASEAEYAACVELQRATWGRDFKETVPPSMMLVAQKVGGVAVGAFDDAGALLGFVYGITGVRDGEIVHWSDMLAVRADAQGRGIGRRLKEFQRMAAAQVGARAIYWTYDPLVARNAHLNFNVFGVTVAEYVPNMYGSGTGSDLHRGIGTDRLVVAWPVNDAELARRRAETAGARHAPEFQDAPTLGDVDHIDRAAETAVGRADRLRVAVPLDVSPLLEHDPLRASRWRDANRAAFQRAFASQYRVAGFVADGERDRGFYLLAR